MRVKYLLEAPEGVSESLIEGTPYWPDEENRIETANPNHLRTLKLHGYKVVSEVTMLPPARARVHSSIDIDDLGRTGLADALRDRGASFPEAATRSDLAEIASSWNAARGIRPAPKAAAPATAPLAQRAAPAPKAAPPEPVATQAETVQPEPPAKAPTAAADGDAVDFSQLPYEDLKGWLAARGVSFPGNGAKKVLIGLAETTHAAIKAKAAQAA